MTHKTVLKLKAAVILKIVLKAGHDVRYTRENRLMRKIRCGFRNKFGSGSYLFFLKLGRLKMLNTISACWESTVLINFVGLQQKYPSGDAVFWKGFWWSYLCEMYSWRKNKDYYILCFLLFERPSVWSQKNKKIHGYRVKKII